MLIKNGYIIDPASGRAEFADLQISDGKIFSIGQHLSVSPSEEIIDASGLTIAPGLIDTHVHFRDPGFTYKEDIHTGASASAAGGFTSVICMANTSPVVDSVSVFSGLAAREKEEAIHIYQAAAVSHDLKGTELTDMKALAAAGAADECDGLAGLNFERNVPQCVKFVEKQLMLQQLDGVFLEGLGFLLREVETHRDILHLNDGHGKLLTDTE